ncbi:MAG: DUF1800 domain-containing protein [Burkholderiaceae bacterium]
MDLMSILRIIILALPILVAGCSGGSSEPFTGAPPAALSAKVGITTAAATRFLEQATFGPTPAEILHLQDIGYDAWFSEQFSSAVTPYPPFAANSTLDAVQAVFFKNALTAKDQLRQRASFALSQIFVVSDQKIDSRSGVANYQNLLLNDTFGSYRQLLRDVTLSPAMGAYLDMANNTKADPSIGTTPNENYGREVLQLFSVGLVKLNPDGTPMLGTGAKPVATYTQDIVEGYSRAFTGWTYPLRPGAATQLYNDIYFTGAMESRDASHEPGAKRLLNDVQIPAGQTAVTDLDAAINTIAQHPNVGPFIGYRLIQALVKSNPSPSYVARVTKAFDGAGPNQRGDLKSVLTAVLMDSEARAGDTQALGRDDGKVREPVLYMTRLLRAFNVSTDGTGLPAYAQSMRQDVFNAPSVFNFYPPSHRLRGSALVAPELKIVNTSTVAARFGFAGDLTANALPAGTKADFSELYAIAQDAPALVDALDQRLMHGTMTPATRASIVRAVGATGSDAQARAMLALYLAAVSPAFTIQR